VDFVDIVVSWGEVLIGLGLIFGVLTCLAAFWGALIMLLFYLGNWDGSHGYSNRDVACMLVFRSVIAFGAGRILALDQYIEQYEISGELLVERYPWTQYFLR
jgi:thiosulfate dehydrogenase [quinone] large subunit